MKIIEEGKTYLIPKYKLDKNIKGLIKTDESVELKWVKGDRNLDNPCVQEGIISEDLLKCVKTHLEFINVGHLKNDYTTESIEFISKAIKCLVDRKVDREERDVFGTNKI